MFRYRFGVYSASGESVQGGFILAIPDIQTIVYQGFDDTHHIYQLKQRSLEFESVIRECGLFILN
jgi:hypothetical protein